MKYENHVIEDAMFKIYGLFEDFNHLQWGKGECNEGVCRKIDENCYTESSTS